MKHFVPEKEAYGRLSLRERNSGLEPADNRKPPTGIVIEAFGPVKIQARIKCQWQPHIPGVSRTEFGKVWFRHSDDCYGDAIQVEGLTHNRGIGAKLALPIAIIEDSDGCGAWNIVGRLEHPPQCGADTQSLEELTGYERAVDSRSIAASIEVEPWAACESGHTGKDPRL